MKIRVNLNEFHETMKELRKEGKVINYVVDVTTIDLKDNGVRKMEKEIDYK